MAADRTSVVAELAADAEGTHSDRARRLWITTGALAFAVVLAGTVPSLPPRGLAHQDNIVNAQVARNLLHGLGPVLTEPTPDDPQ